MPKLVLLAGLPGAGKSTYARTFFDLKYAIISSDAIREELAGSTRAAHEQDLRPWDVFYSRIEDSLRHDVDVIADATFLTRKHRLRAQRVAILADAELHIVLFKNLQDALARNRERPEDTRVPGPAMAGMLDLYFDTISDLPSEAYDSVTMVEGFA